MLTRSEPQVEMKKVRQHRGGASRHCFRKDEAPLSEAALRVPLLTARHVFPNALRCFGKRRSGGNVNSGM
jgi:hypothetical protein